MSAWSNVEFDWVKAAQSRQWAGRPKCANRVTQGVKRTIGNAFNSNNRESMKTKIFAIVRWSIFLLILLGWLFNFPHFLISNYIGEHFPFPDPKLWKWSALLVEVCLVEFSVCIPFVFPIAVLCRNLAIPASIFLFVIFIVHALFSLLTAANGVYFFVLLIFQIICHCAFLIGGTYLARRHMIEKPKSDFKMALN
jgi:hypothetical protein